MRPSKATAVAARFQRELRLLGQPQVRQVVRRLVDRVGVVRLDEGMPAPRGGWPGPGRRSAHRCRRPGRQWSTCRPRAVVTSAREAGPVALQEQEEQVGEALEAVRRHAADGRRQAAAAVERPTPGCGGPGQFSGVVRFRSSSRKRAGGTARSAGGTGSAAGSWWLSTPNSMTCAGGGTLTEARAAPRRAARTPPGRLEASHLRHHQAALGRAAEGVQAFGPVPVPSRRTPSWSLTAQYSVHPHAPRSGSITPRHVSLSSIGPSLGPDRPFGPTRTATLPLPDRSCPGNGGGPVAGHRARVQLATVAAALRRAGSPAAACPRRPGRSAIPVCGRRQK